MRILVIGSGGREHAICAAFKRSKRVTRIFCAPGNAGIAAAAECVATAPDEIDNIADFAASKDIDLTFVGGETALALGIVDEFERRGLKIIGPTVAAARLESSKAFAKDFMLRHSIPTAAYETAASPAEAIEILHSGKFGGPDSPVVVKADGLAAGKGVVVARERGEAISAINEMSALVGNEASATIVLEECLVGREVSLLMFADGENFALMPPTRDHKRIGEGDTGPNTGGMGTITDTSLLTDEQTREIVETIIKPTLAGCVAEGFPFRGILFLGLMMTEAVSSKENLEVPPAAANRQLQAKLLEYNVRFGDPEAQSILVRLETDLVDICEAMLAGRLSEFYIKWKAGNSACVILAAEGYPQKAQVGDVIHGLEKAAEKESVTVFHSGTEFGGNVGSRNDVNPPVEFVTAGGRVVGVTAIGENLDAALSSAYEAVGEISWKGMQYRRDIGKNC